MAANLGPDAGLRSIFKERLPAWHWTPIETGIIISGVPDTNCCWQGYEFWIECKRTAAFAINFRPEQVGWLTRRRRAGGAAFVAVRKLIDAPGPRQMDVDELWLFDGADAVLLSDGGLNGAAVPLGRWTGGPGRWAWDDVARLLLAPASPVSRVAGLGEASRA